MRGLHYGFCLGLLSCSLGPNPVVCETSDQCRSAFGLGSTCDPTGFCTEFAANARCADTEPSDLLVRRDAYADRVVIGALFNSVTDEPQVRSAKLAVQQANEVRPEGSPEFGLVVCGYEADLSIDGQSSEEAVLASATWLSETLDVPAIVGAASSDRTLNAFSVTSDADIVLISPSATSPELTLVDETSPTDDNPGLLWRTVPPDDLQGRVIAADLEQRGIGWLAILEEQSSYATSLANVVEQNFTGTVLRIPFSNTTELTEAVVEVKGAWNGHVDDEAANFGALVQPGEFVFLSSEANDVVAYLDALPNNFSDDTCKSGGTPIPDCVNPGIFLSDAGADPFILASVSAQATEAFPSIRGTRPKVPDGVVFETFQAAYAAAFDSEDARDAVYSSYTYDATWMVMYGVAWADAQEGGPGGRSIAKGFRRVSDTSGPLIEVKGSSWPAVLDAFGQGQSIDLLGASGSLDFDPATEETSGPVEIWVVADNSVRAVATCEPDLTCASVGADADGDGWEPPEDCNDQNYYVNPDADEVSNDGIDNDCNGLIDD